MKWTREATVWRLGFLAAIVGHAASHTRLIPLGYVETTRDVADLIGFICGYLSASPLPFGGGRRPFTLNINGKDPS